MSNDDKNIRKSFYRVLVRLLRKNGIKKAGVFGSYAKGKQKKGSDIDILIEFDGSLMECERIRYIF